MTEKLIKMLESCRHTLTMYSGLMASDQKDMKHAFELNNEKLIDKIDRVLQDAIRHRHKYHEMCNGFKNKETASVIMYIDNNASILKSAFRFVRISEGSADKLAQDLAFWLEPENTMYGAHKDLFYQLLVDAHMRVDWHQVAEHCLNKYKEIHG